MVVPTTKKSTTPTKTTNRNGVLAAQIVPTNARWISEPPVPAAPSQPGAVAWEMLRARGQIEILC